MTFKNRTDVPFIGGPLAGTLASSSRSTCRSAVDGKALPVSYGNRWLVGHQHEKGNPKVAAQARRPVHPTVLQRLRECLRVGAGLEGLVGGWSTRQVADPGGLPPGHPPPTRGLEDTAPSSCSGLAFIARPFCEISTKPIWYVSWHAHLSQLRNFLRVDAPGGSGWAGAGLLLIPLLPPRRLPPGAGCAPTSQPPGAIGELPCRRLRQVA
jgi:hypothetical protein